MTAWQPPTDAEGILKAWYHECDMQLQGTSAERRALCEEMIPMFVNSLRGGRGAANVVLRLALELARTADGDAS